MSHTCGLDHPLLPAIDYVTVRCRCGAKYQPVAAKAEELGIRLTDGHSQRYFRCRECGEVWWHNGETLERVSDDGQRLLRQIGLL